MVAGGHGRDGVSLMQMPRIAEGNVAAGESLPGVAATLGLPSGIPIAAGAGDAAAGGSDRCHR